MKTGAVSRLRSSLVKCISYLIFWLHTWHLVLKAKVYWGVMSLASELSMAKAG